MVILQFQFTNIDEDDAEIIPNFCEFLIDRILETLNTKMNLKKIQLRLKYLYEEASWINWYGSKKYDTTATSLLQAVNTSFKAVPYKNNLWKIEVNPNVLIPNSSTSIDRFIRYLNYGDLKSRPTGIFTKIESYFDHNKIKQLWNLYTLSYYGGISDVEIIAK